jgi:hypothetical protein
MQMIANSRNRMNARRDAHREAEALMKSPLQEALIRKLGCQGPGDLQLGKLSRELSSELSDWADFIRSLDWQTCKML